MNPTHQVRSSPGRGEPHTFSAAGSTQNQYFDTAIDPHGTSEHLQGYHDSIDRLYESANEANQYHDLGFEGNTLHNRQPSAPTSTSAARNDHDVLRGIANYVAQSSPSTQYRETSGLFPHQAPSPYMVTGNPSSFPASVNTAEMSLTKQATIEQHTTGQDDAAQERQTKYEPFQNRFHSSEQARDHRRWGTRFDRIPYREPDTDHTIVDIEHNRVRNVMRIYNAITSGEAAKDNRGSIAMKRWVLDAHYPSDLVEAYAHKVFDCLLLQAKEGFRGWVHNDYVADERKGDDIDKDVDCAGRLENIILALEQEKTICEDVMNSACQIRMFVNAPRAYANRKHQNRVGNSKRGRTKDTPEPNTKAAKARRIANGRARTHSTATPGLLDSRETPPQQPQSLQRPPLMPPNFSSPASQQLSPSPVISSYSAPRTMALHIPAMSASRSSFGQQSVTAMPPPTSSPQTFHAPQMHVPRMTIEPPLPHLPFASPPLRLYTTNSASASPDELKPVDTDAIPAGWSNLGNTEETSFPSWMQSTSVIDPNLSPWNPYNTRGGDGASANMLANQPGEYVNLSDIENSLLDGMGSSSNDNTFDDMWRMHSDAQDFLSPSSGQLDRP